MSVIRSELNESPPYFSVNMSKIEMLRLLINQRLTAAAEEIFLVFGKTIALYEEEISRSRREIDRQRRLLDLSRTPQIRLQAASPGEEPPSHARTHTRTVILSQFKQCVCSGLALWEQQDCGSSLDQDVKKEAKPPEHESREVGGATPPLGGAQEVDCASRLQPPDPEPDLDPALSAQQTHLDPGEEDLDPAGAQVPLCQVLDSYICTVCGGVFAQRAHWAKHVQMHRRVAKKADGSYTCGVCGKRLTRLDGYQKHLRVHTGEKPYCCAQCGRRFSDNSNFKRHVRTHAQKPQQR